MWKWNPTQFTSHLWITLPADLGFFKNEKEKLVTDADRNSIYVHEKTDWTYVRKINKEDCLKAPYMPL